MMKQEPLPGPLDSARITQGSFDFFKIFKSVYTARGCNKREIQCCQVF